MDPEVDVDASASSRAAAAARSCTTCAKAKTKCVKAPGNRVCDRCARLAKDCYFKEPVVKRKKVIKSTRAAQFEKLETKIEHLVNALSTSQNRSPSNFPGQPSPPLSQPDTAVPTGARQYEVLNSLCGEGPTKDKNHDSSVRPLQPASVHHPPECTMARPPAALHQAENQGLGVSFSEAEILLERYCRLMAPTFPFVVLEQDVTAATLYSEKPFLLRAIVTVACFHDLTKQQALLKHCMRELSERVLVNNEKNLGLIEAMLIIITWFHPHVFSSGQLTNILNLCNAMSTDLGIDRSPSHCVGFRTSTTKAIDGHTPPTRQHTLQEHRLAAGVWYVTSMFAAAFVKFSVHPYPKYLDECLSRLEAIREYESDMFLVQTVRLQHLIEDVTASSSTAPSKMYIKALELHLNQIREQDKSHEQGVLLKLHYQKVKVHIWELCLNELLETRTQPLQNYIEGVCNLTRAVKASLDTFFTIPPSIYLTLPFSAFNHFAHAFITLTKVASLEIDGWDPSNINEIIDFPTVTDKVIADFERSSTISADGLMADNDTFKAWAGKLRWMKQVYDTRFSADASTHGRPRPLGGAWPSACDIDHPVPSAAPPQHPQQQHPQQHHQQHHQHQQPTPPEDFLSSDFISSLDDAFWSTFANDLDMDVNRYMAPETM